jgi:hypothetical protein
VIPGGAMQGLIIWVIGVWIGVVGLSWAAMGTSTPQAERDRVMAMAAHRMIVMQGWPCQKPDGATHVESRGGDETSRISRDGQQPVYRLVIRGAGETRLERW